jgi:hypothetical protein
MGPRALSGSSITSAKRRAEGSVLQRELTASSLGSTDANLARRSVLHPRGKLLGKRDILTCRVADMGRGECMPSGSRARLHAFYAYKGVEDDGAQRPCKIATVATVRTGLHRRNRRNI